MAKKNNEIVNDPKLSKKYGDEYSLGVVDENISDFCEECMKIFGANINILRHTPFLIDGLKPGARRILWTMWAIYNARHTGPFKKVATIVSNTIQIHPHGPTAVYESLVKMAQEWNNLVCPIEGDGNFGSVIGTDAAADRYISARLSYFAYKCFFEDFEDGVVNMVDSYSGEYKIPEYLPAKYPNVIINNSFGIGYGVSCSIPTFNFKEVCDLTIKLIKNPSLKNVYLIPDVSTGADVIDDGQFLNACQSGRGSFRIRGQVEIHDNVIDIKSAPLKTSILKIKDEVMELNDKSKIGLVGIKNDTYKDTKTQKVIISLKLIFRKGMDMTAIEHMLYKKTSLQKTEPLIFSVVDDYNFVNKSLKDIIVEWIDYRRETKRKIYNKKYVKASERIHILDILINILSDNNLSDTVKIVQKSDDDEDGIKKLVKRYGMSSLQAKNIMKMSINNFTKKAKRRYEEEREVKLKEMEKYKKIILSKSMIDEIIIEELLEGNKLFGEPRRSKVINIEGEQTISLTDHIVVFTKEGKVKKLSADAKDVGFIDQGDYPIEICKINNGNALLVFDMFGKVFNLPIHQIPSTDPSTSGIKITEIVGVQGEVRSIIPKPVSDTISKLETNTGDDISFVMVTKNGIIKKTSVSRFTSINKELVAMNVKDSDELVGVLTIIGDKDIIVYTDCGMGVRINTEFVKETARTSIGVKALDLENDENVIGMSLVNRKDKDIFVLTSRGNGKKCSLSSFATMERNSKPLRITSLSDNEKLIKVQSIRGDERFKVFMKSSVVELTLTDVKEMPRLSKGIKIVPVRKGEVIIDIKEIK